MLKVLIGEAPSRRSDPTRPFSGRSGARLEALLGSPLAETFELLNIFGAWPGLAPTGRGTLWDPAAACDRARVMGTRLRGRSVVFVGRRVAAAFEHSDSPHLTWGRDLRGFDFAVIPHPSGIVRWWNDHENVSRAREFLRSIA